MKLAIIPGDGVGPEIAREIHKIFSALESYTRIKFNLHEFDLGKAYYQETGFPVSSTVIDECRNSDAIWIGPLAEKAADGTKLKNGIFKSFIERLNLTILDRAVLSFNPSGGLLNDDVYNIRVLQDVSNSFTVSPYLATRLSDNESAFLNLDISTSISIDPIVEYIKSQIDNKIHSRLTVALLDSQLNKDNPWLRRINDLLNDHDIMPVYLSIDFLLFKLLHKPDDLDLILTVPPFGQLISKLAAAMEGGLGLAYESYRSPEGQRLFHVLHPPSERFTGKDAANPLGTFRSLVAILQHLKQDKLAAVLDESIGLALEAGWSTRDLGGSMGTSEVGDFICSKISQLID